MKDLSSVLRTAYYSRLNGNLTYNSSNVPVYDRVSNTVSYPFVLLGEFRDTDDSDKTFYAHNCTQEVEVITAFDGNHGGKKASDNISDQIIERIRTRSSGYMVLNSSFNMTTTTLDETFTLTEEAGEHIVYRRVIRFRHLVDENQ